MSFNKVYIHPNLSRDPEMRITSRLIAELAVRGVTATVFDGDPPGDADLIICVGGDGTILAIASIAGGVPILGVNAGNVGFMTAFDASECGLISEVLDGRYEIHSHMLLCVEILRGGVRIPCGEVLNDAVVTASKVARAVSLNLHSDGHFMAKVRGDGVIAATPTGSTAYSMSAGGPVVCSTAAALILTPICAHNVSVSSFVLPSSSEICIEVLSAEAGLTLDGMPSEALLNGDKVIIRKSGKVCRLIRLQSYNFYDIISNKLFSER